MNRRLLATILCAALIAGEASAARAASAGDRNLKAAEAYVAKRCPASTREISSSAWIHEFAFNALYGNCRAGDGRDQRIWFFESGRFVGTDAPTSSHDIIASWRDEKTLVFLYVLYRQSNAECCPTGGAASVRYLWDGRRVRRLDPLPRRAFLPGVRAGR